MWERNSAYVIKAIYAIFLTLTPIAINNYRYADDFCQPLPNLEFSKMDIQNISHMCEWENAALHPSIEELSMISCVALGKVIRQVF